MPVSPGSWSAVPPAKAAALEHGEQLQLLDAVLERVAPERVAMGLAGNNQAQLLAFQREVLERPIAGLLVPAPYYIRPPRRRWCASSMGSPTRPACR